MIDLQKKVKKNPYAISDSQDGSGMRTSDRLLASTQNLYSSSNSTVKFIGSQSVTTSTKRYLPFLASSKDMEI